MIIKLFYIFKSNIIFENIVNINMRHYIFDQDYYVIKIPEKEQDIKEQVVNLTKIVSKIKEKININEEKKEEILNEQKDDIKMNKLDCFLNKESTAKNSFFGISFLQDDEKN